MSIDLIKFKLHIDIFTTLHYTNQKDVEKMFENLHYKKLKEAYDTIISFISDNNIDGLKVNIDNAYSAALELFSKMHKAAKKSKLVIEEWQEVERMLANLSTISAYYYGYLSYYYFQQFDKEFNNKNYKEAIETCYNARFRKNEMFKFKITPINEECLTYVKDNKKYYCQGMSRIINDYNKSLETSIDSISLDRHRKVEKILDEIKERERAEQERIDEENYKIWQLKKQEEKEQHNKKVQENYECMMERGSFFSYINPSHSLECYKSAYNWAKDEEGFEDKLERARKKVVDAYVELIKERSNFFHGVSNRIIVDACQTGLNLCEEAFKWTTSNDNYKIEELKSDLTYEYNKAYGDYYEYDED